MTSEELFINNHDAVLISKTWRWVFCRLTQLTTHRQTYIHVEKCVGDVVFNGECCLTQTRLTCVCVTVRPSTALWWWHTTTSWHHHCRQHAVQRDTITSGSMQSRVTPSLAAAPACTLCLKKGSTKPMAITLSNLNRFSKFLWMKSEGNFLNKD